MSNPETKVTHAMVPRELAARPGGLALKVHTGPLAGQTLAVAKPSIKVGRSRAVDLTIADRSISKVHFALRATESGAELRDLGSKNGLWLGQRRIFHVGLIPGDVFTAGECRLELVDVAEVEVEVSTSEWCGELYGQSVVMRELFTLLERVAPTPLDVLIQGETGTGKELAARSLHQLSDRAERPFIVLDCASLPETLADATLFGFKKGAFTGADHDQPGLFEQADGGTVFIDEIGELPLAQQTKLLRVLDRRELSRLGEPGVLRRVDLRVIAATNRNLAEEVSEGRFREDLLHRLNQELLTMPPLRERPGDAVELAEVMIDELAEDHGLTIELGDDARAALPLYAWPGNVRELRNAIRRAVLLRREGTVRAADIRFGRGDGVASKLGEVLSHAGDYEQTHLEFDRVFVPSVLREFGGNLSAASNRLGISRDRLRRRLMALGLYGDGA
ncbi:Regulatory protein LuxO [Enhygromyxa salina]|uniref:Regulatory protein LuxO n=1 Tax=Enhygromyxa salina TaxID=215803 RepID=A0A2S9XAN6_9BACT|nr:sigma 54-interacting transcriptional regulator [Enhygromyxa salina]PRP89909.1 Regulatory protein LuxO [Enhygromyxa salina]